MIAYLVTNAINGKQYVGISKHSTPQKRWNRHLRAARYGETMFLCRAIRKYGEGAFRCEMVAEASSWKELLATEVFLIEKYGTFAPRGYNMTRGGEGMLGNIVSAETRAKKSVKLSGKPMSDGQKAKLRDAWKIRILTLDRDELRKRNLGRRASPETRAKISANSGVRGRKLSPEHLAKLLAANVGRKLSDETKEKISKAHLGIKPSPESKAKKRDSSLGIKRPYAREIVVKATAAAAIANRGRKQTPEHKARRLASRNATMRAAQIVPGQGSFL